MTNATDTAERIVWMRSLWHRDCDPFVTIVALDGDTCTRQIDACGDEEWERMREDFPCPECGEFGEPGDDDAQFICNVHGEHTLDDDIMTGGQFNEPLANLELTPEQTHELDTEGYVSID